EALERRRVLSAAASGVLALGNLSFDANATAIVKTGSLLPGATVQTDLPVAIDDIPTAAGDGAGDASSGDSQDSSDPAGGSDATGDPCDTGDCSDNGSDNSADNSTGDSGDNSGGIIDDNGDDGGTIVDNQGGVNDGGD